MAPLPMANLILNTIPMSALDELLANPELDLQVLTKDDLVRFSIQDPVLFAQQWLGVDTWSKQEEILQSMAVNTKTAVKACHASGKTFTAACATLHHLAAYEEGIVITTAPTLNQVEKLLWAEVHTLVGKSLYPFPKPVSTQLKITPKRYALGFTTSVQHGDEGVKFQGFHSKHILIILDEAPGVAGKLWEAIEGIMASGDVRLLALGNPVIASGPFYDAFGVNRAQWHTITISAFDTPNFVGVNITYKEIGPDGKERVVFYGDPNGKDLMTLTREELKYCPTPYLTSRQWIRDRFAEWGPTHPNWKSRCLGQFADQSPDSLLSLTWLEQARVRPSVAPPIRLSKEGIPLTKRRFRAGLDVAGPGEDETVLCVQEFGHIVLLQSWPSQDPRGEVVQALAPYRGMLETVNVDVIGIGWGMARHLEDMKFPVSDINVGNSSDEPPKYANFKAQAYWGLREQFQEGQVSGLTDDLAISQLAGIRYKPNSRGQILIESKEDAAKRGVKSPDRAEAIMLAFARSATHGLIEHWARLAEELRMKRDGTVVPNVTATDLADAQKIEETVWDDKKPTANSPEDADAWATWKKRRDPSQTDVKPVSPTVTQCPICKGRSISNFAEGWRCNECRASNQTSQ